MSTARERRTELVIRLGRRIRLEVGSPCLCSVWSLDSLFLWGHYATVHSRGPNDLLSNGNCLLEMVVVCIVSMGEFLYFVFRCYIYAVLFGRILSNILFRIKLCLGTCFFIFCIAMSCRVSYFGRAHRG